MVMYRSAVEDQEIVVLQRVGAGRVQANAFDQAFELYKCILLALRSVTQTTEGWVGPRTGVGVPKRKSPSPNGNLIPVCRCWPFTMATRSKA
jgi:hypothetical protein